MPVTLNLIACRVNSYTQQRQKHQADTALRMERTKPNQEWREPTNEEVELLINDEIERFGINAEEADELVQNAYVQVLDNFQSSSPGYSGRIMFVVFGYPQTADFFMFAEDTGADGDGDGLIPICPEWAPNAIEQRDRKRHD